MTPLTERSPAPFDVLSAATLAEIDRLRPRELAVGVMTYNNAETIGAVVEAAARGSGLTDGGLTAAIINVDAGSADGTVDRLAAGPLPSIRMGNPAPMTERAAVPFHGVPGRGMAMRATMAAAHRLGARALVLLEADVISLTPEWVPRLAGPVLAEKADFVTAAYDRRRWDGTITKLLLSPLVQALYGRRLGQPLGGQQALAARLVEHLLIHPKWDWRSRDIVDLWIVGTAIADGFSLWESWLGAREVRSGTRTADLPAMVAQTLGSVFRVMDRHQDLWLEVRGSEPLAALGRPADPEADGAVVDVERMIEGFRLGLRDLTPLWEQILAPETLGDVLGLDVPDPGGFRFPDDLWARVVYDFALGHHYGVVHRDHLLRSLVPLYLGRTAAFVLATRGETGAAVERRIAAVGAAFERQKPYLVERWR